MAVYLVENERDHQMKIARHNFIAYICGIPYEVSKEEFPKVSRIKEICSQIKDNESKIVDYDDELRDLIGELLKTVDIKDDYFLSQIKGVYGDLVTKRYRDYFSDLTEEVEILSEMAVKSPTSAMEYIYEVLKFFLAHQNDVYLDGSSKIYTKYSFVKDPDKTGGMSKNIEVDCNTGTYSRHDINGHANVNVTPAQLANELIAWYNAV